MRSRGHIQGQHHPKCRVRFNHRGSACSLRNRPTRTRCQLQDYAHVASELGFGLVRLHSLEHGKDREREERRKWVNMPLCPRVGNERGMLVKWKREVQGSGVLAIVVSYHSYNLKLPAKNCRLVKSKSRVGLHRQRQMYKKVNKKLKNDVKQINETKSKYRAKHLCDIINKKTCKATTLCCNKAMIVGR